MQVSEASTMKDSPGGKNVFSQNFTIHNVTLEDRGIYMCNVSDKQDHFSFNTINVTIYGIYFFECRKALVSQWSVSRFK